MFQSDFCHIEYLHDIHAVFCKWKQFCHSDDYKDPLSYGLKLIRENQAKTWITDTSTGFENREADTQWLIKNFMPELIKSSCEEIIFIITKDSPLQEEIAGQKKSLSQHFKITLVEDLEKII